VNSSIETSIICSWNVNGIRAIKKKGLDSIIEERGWDYLCLQETKIQPDQLNSQLTNPSGYVSAYESAQRKGYSGVAIFGKNGLPKTSAGFGNSEFDIEGRTIVAEFKDFLLYNIYFPNGGASIERLSYKLRFYDSILQHLQEKIAEGHEIILCGDVNTAHNAIDLARPAENERSSGFLREEREWIDRLISSGFTDVFRFFNQEPEQYTWWDYKTRARERNIGWRIDYFFATKKIMQKIRNCTILNDVMGSDHCPIEITIEMEQ
jgi:exodeoxyribonuclease-3